MARPKKAADAVSDTRGDNVAAAKNDSAAHNDEPMYTEAQVKELIQLAVDKAMEQSAARVVQVSANVEKVHFLWQAEVSEDNVFEIGPNGIYGRIVGRTGSFYVPKPELSRVMDTRFRLLLNRRWIIVVDGMTEEERNAYGVNYKEGEILDQKAFARMAELGGKLTEIYGKLCPGHREMVAKRFHEAYAEKSPLITRNLVVELNRMSKKLGSTEGDFADIIDAMNEADKDK